MRGTWLDICCETCRKGVSLHGIRTAGNGPAVINRSKACLHAQYRLLL